jgi:hypothetical protein
MRRLILVSLKILLERPAVPSEIRTSSLRLLLVAYSGGTAFIYDKRLITFPGTDYKEQTIPVSKRKIVHYQTHIATRLPYNRWQCRGQTNDMQKALQQAFP